MSNQQQRGSETPQELLAATDQLTHQVRKAQRGTWFPLLVFAIITYAAIPVRHLAPRSLKCVSQSGGGRICTVFSTTLTAYWVVAFIAAYVVIAWFYIHRARARGVGARVKPYVIAGVVIALVLTAVWVWVAGHPVTNVQLLGIHLQGNGGAHAFYSLISPASAIGIALLVLVWIERNWWLLGFTLVYLATVFGYASVFGSVSPVNASFATSRNFVEATVLLLGSLGFVVADYIESRRTS